MQLIPVFLNQNTSPPFQTNVNLDGASYTLSLRFNIAGQRYYYSLTSLNGIMIINAPLIGSPLNYDIDLAPGLFLTSKIIFRAATNQFEITP